MPSYYLANADISAGVLELLATSAPSSPDEAQGWTVDKKSSGSSVYYPDIVRAATTFLGEPSAFSQYGYRTASTLNGQFANDNWVLSCKVKCNAYYAQRGRVKYRLWRSVNADGAAAVQITPGWQQSAQISFTAANQYQTGTIVWSPGSSVDLDNDYLFLEIEWVAEVSGGNNAAVVYWVHNEGAAEKLDTPAFTEAAITGNLSGAAVALTGALTGAYAVVGTLAGSPAPVIGAVGGAHGVAGALEGSPAAITGAIAGTTVQPVTGALAGSPGQVTGVFTGAVAGQVTGGLGGTLHPVAGGIVGAHGVAGTLAGSVGQATAGLTGGHGVAGAVAGSVGLATGGFTGALGVAGTLSGSLTPVPAAMAGVYVPTGALAGAIAAVTGAVAGNVLRPIAGALAGVLPPSAGFWTGISGSGTATGWKFPTFFSEYGFGYGDYDPGMTAAIAIGCLSIYLRTGDERAGAWARRILDDLRENRRDPVFGGYKSDYRYAWLNGLALRAFGLAAHGAAGQAFVFPAAAADREHFEALMAWVFAHAGDEKPNVLNADLIPFAYSDAVDIWDNAPHYLAMSRMGTLEGLTAMLGAALEYGKGTGEWTWWQRLLDFVLTDHLVELSGSQIRSVSLAYEQTGARNLVRVLYADYDRDNTRYAESKAEAAIDTWGEAPLELDCRYGSPVVVEDPDVAQLLADRLLARLAAPRELAEVETWLEGVRLELGDTVALSSDFHGLDREEFTLRGKDLDLGERLVRLSLDRPLNTSWSWAVDASGGPRDAFAIEAASVYDADWACRAEAG